MDILTHAITGLTGSSLIKKIVTAGVSSPSTLQEARLYGILFFAASLFPDVDNITRLWGVEAYIVHHRGATHSISFMVAFSCLVAMLSRYVVKSASSLSIGLAVGGGIGTHLFMDLITSYGTQLLWPYSTSRFSLDWVFIVDIIYTVGLLVLLLLALSLRRNHKWLIGCFSLWIFGYPTLCGITKAATTAWAKGHLTPPSENLVLSPELGSPLIWKVIVSHNHFYRLGRVSLLSTHPLSFLTHTFPHLNHSLLSATTPPFSLLSTYQWFAVYPYQREHPSSQGGKIIEIGDLRFVSTLPFVRSRRTFSPFTIFLYLSDQGELLTARYGSPSGPPLQ